MQEISGYEELDGLLGETASIKLMANYFYNQIKDLKEMMTAVMKQVESVSNSLEAANATQNTVDNLRHACQLMAAKVDNAATPVTSFVSTFNNNI
jgi:hypothetical protein